MASRCIAEPPLNNIEGLNRLMIIRKIFGLFMTALIFCAAILIGRVLWVHYMDQPWTRDARVRADVINVAPDVSGAVVTMPVADNAASKRRVVG